LTGINKSHSTVNLSALYLLYKIRFCFLKGYDINIYKWVSYNSYYIKVDFFNYVHISDVVCDYITTYEHRTKKMSLIVWFIINEDNNLVKQRYCIDYLHWKIGLIL